MIEVLKQMQEALREYHYYTIDAGLPNQSMLNKGYAAYQAGLKAIAELESQEPDKYEMDIECTKCGAKQSGVLTVNTHSPQRKPLTDEIVGLLKEARKIIRASSSRNLVKDWDERTTKAIAAHGIKE